MSRTEKTFTLTPSSGIAEKYTLYSAITVDDIMLMRMKAIAAEIKTGEEFDVPVPKSVKDYLVRVLVSAGS
jgi:hypothetical protein